MDIGFIQDGSKTKREKDTITTAEAYTGTYNLLPPSRPPTVLFLPIFNIPGTGTV